MWQSIVSLLKDIGEQWAKLSTSRKLAAGAVLLIVVTSMITLGVWVGEKSYTPLYTNLQPEASIELVRILQEDRIPYLVSDEGRTISIPPELIQPTLMRLAVRGMPGGQAPGLELFDKESFGTSSYVQRINYVRALQGELTRTINTIRAVSKSSVHISMPPRSSFLDEVEAPKASVVLQMNPAMSLNSNEVKGIQNLVAYSVEGLRPERVAVVDNTGRALSSSGDTVSALTSTMIEKQRRLEGTLEDRVQDIVGRIVGQGNIVARVNAELDFDPSQEEERLYDPEQSALRSEDKQENNMEASRPLAGGVAGAQGALPGPAAEAPESRQQVARSANRSSYDVSTKIRRSEKALGGVRRLSVAVLVNHVPITDAEGVTTMQPISPEQRVTIANLVRDAIGFVETRDSVTIESASFAIEDLEKADTMLLQQERRHLIYSLIRYGTVALFVLLFFSFIVRPFIKWLTGLNDNKIETILPRTVEELESITDHETNSLPGMASLPMIDENVDIDKAENELLKEKVVSMIEMHPSKASQILSDWLIAGDGSQPVKAKGRR